LDSPGWRVCGNRAQQNQPVCPYAEMAVAEQLDQFLLMRRKKFPAVIHQNEIIAGTVVLGKFKEHDLKKNVENLIALANKFLRTSNNPKAGASALNTVKGSGRKYNLKVICR
jgi:hypothetical protein